MIIHGSEDCVLNYWLLNPSENIRAMRSLGDTVFLTFSVASTKLSNRNKGIKIYLSSCFQSFSPLCQGRHAGAYYGSGSM